MKRELPHGTFITFHDLAPATTDADLQALILARTGVEIPIERISVVTRWNDRAAKISLGWDHVSDIISWALGEDSLHGRPLNIVKPQCKNFR